MNVISSLTLDRIILIFMMVFSVLGAVDHIRGDRNGMGKAFAEGFGTMGSLALAVAAVYASSPFIASVLSPFVGRLAALTGIDAGTVPGIFLSSDMGGYALSMEMASDEAMGNFGGLILAGTIGQVWVFVIPVALSAIEKKDRRVFASGLLCGLVTVPSACIAGGGVMMLTGFSLTFSSILLNTLPAFILAAAVSLFLVLKPGPTVKVFSVFGTLVTALITALTAVAAFEEVTGITFPVFSVMVERGGNGLTGLDEGLLLCGKIALVLSGAFPMMKWLEKHCRGFFNALGRKLGINTSSTLGLLSTTANAIPMFASYSSMDEKGKLLNASFVVSAGFTFGDYLGFAAGVGSRMVPAMLAAKLTGGVCALVLASLLSPVLLGKGKE